MLNRSRMIRDNSAVLFTNRRSGGGSSRNCSEDSSGHTENANKNDGDISNVKWENESRQTRSLWPCLSETEKGSRRTQTPKTPPRRGSATVAI